MTEYQRIGSRVGFVVAREGIVWEVCTRNFARYSFADVPTGVQGTLPARAWGHAQSKQVGSNSRKMVLALENSEFPQWTNKNAACLLSVLCIFRCDYGCSATSDSSLFLDDDRMAASFSNLFRRENLLTWECRQIGHHKQKHHVYIAAQTSSIVQI